MNWEEGEVKTITIAATAGNVATTKTPGAGKKWKLLYGRILLTCDATVTNRYIQINITTTGHGAVLAAVSGTTAITASQSKDFGYLPILPINSTVPCPISNFSQAPLDFIVSGTDEIYTIISGGVVGDSYSGYLKVIELPA